MSTASLGFALIIAALFLSLWQGAEAPSFAEADTADSNDIPQAPPSLFALTPAAISLGVRARQSTAVTAVTRPDPIDASPTSEPIQDGAVTSTPTLEPALAVDSTLLPKPTPTARPTPVPDSAEASPAERVSDLAGSLTSLTDILLWQGFRPDNLRVLRRAIDGQDSRVVAADIQAEHGKWSGIRFTASEPFDWTGLQEISIKVRWGTTDGSGGFAFVLEDVEERSWRWYPNLIVFPADDQGWSTWDLVLWEAEQQDEGFRWDQIKWISISTFADTELAAADSVLELALFQVLEDSP